MSTSIQDLLPQVEATTARLESILYQGRLQQAIRLSRAGRYSEAETMLLELGGGKGDNPEILSLLARIHGQQGRLTEAEALLLRAVNLAPDDRSVRSALQAVRDIQQRKSMILMGHAGIISLVAVLVLIAICSVSLLGLPHGRDTGSRTILPAMGKEASMTILSELTNTISQLEEITLVLKKDLASNRQEIAEIRSLQGSLSPSEASISLSADSVVKEYRSESRREDAEIKKSVGALSAELQSLRTNVDQLSTKLVEAEDGRSTVTAAQIQVRGVVVELAHERAIVRFARAVFSQGMEMSPEAKQVLSGFCRRLALTEQTSRVEIVGCVEQLPLFEGRDSLAIRRARLISDILRKEAGLAPEQISVRAASAREIVASGTKDIDLYRGETVVIYIYTSRWSAPKAPVSSNQGSTSETKDHTE
jgi:tetratricopeptide (TPR) repeat protein